MQLLGKGEDSLLRSRMGHATPHKQQRAAALLQKKGSAGEIQRVGQSCWKCRPKRF